MYMKCVEMACLAEKLDFRRQVILYIVVKRDFVDHFEFSKGIEPVKIMGSYKRRRIERLFGIINRICYRIVK